MSIAKAGNVMSFSPEAFDGLSPKLRKDADEIGKFIPGIGDSKTPAGVAKPQAAAAKPKEKATTFVDASQEQRARGAVAQNTRRASAAAGLGRSKESFISALKKKEQPLPTGAVERLAGFIMASAREGGKAQTIAADIARACLLTTCMGVSQTGRGDFEDDNQEAC